MVRAGAEVLLHTVHCASLRSLLATTTPPIDRSQRNCVATHRLGKTQLGSIAAAESKARTAVLYRRPSKVFEDAVASGEIGSRVLGLPGAIPYDGGVPILVDGKVIGAVGVSGMLPQQDGEVGRAKRSSSVVRGWGTARKVAAPIAYWLVLGLITFLGLRAVIKIEGTATRLFLVVVVIVVALRAASLAERLLRDHVPTEIQPNGEPTDVWPRWYSQFSEPIVYRRSDRSPYSYVVLPRPN